MMGDCLDFSGRYIYHIGPNILDRLLVRYNEMIESCRIVYGIFIGS